MNNLKNIIEIISNFFSIIMNFETKNSTQRKLCTAIRKAKRSYFILTGYPSPADSISMVKLEEVVGKLGEQSVIVENLLKDGVVSDEYFAVLLAISIKSVFGMKNYAIQKNLLLKGLS